MNPLQRLAYFGQSVWLDDIRRGLIASGELKRLIKEDGLQGMTSNPATFEKAIGGSADYDEEIRALALADQEAEQICDTLSIQDVQDAADEFWSLYDVSGGQAGFVSLEVNPHLSRRTEETVQESRRLWSALNRPNVFVKVPATRECLPAIRQLTSEGINVNVTLIFSLGRYERVAEAYLAGLEDRAVRGEPLARIRSVASFFLSRIDSRVDPLLETHSSNPTLARQLRGEVAIASAKLAYQSYRKLISSSRWRRLTGQGARPQRLLWASTGTKNPAYPAIKYLEPLIGEDTVTTVPGPTLAAYRDHGKPRARLARGVDKARWVFNQLPKLGIDLDRLALELEEEGIEKFVRPYDKLLKTLRQRIAPFRQEAAEREQLMLS